MNIQETVIYTLDSEEIKSAIYDAFVRKLRELNKNAYFSTEGIQIDEYGYKATLTLTANSEV